MELFGAGTVKLSLLFAVLLLSLIVYFIGKRQAKNKVLKDLNEKLKNALQSGDRNTVDELLRRMRETK